MMLKQNWMREFTLAETKWLATEARGMKLAATNNVDFISAINIQMPTLFCRAWSRAHITNMNPKRRQNHFSTGSEAIIASTGPLFLIPPKKCLNFQVDRSKRSDCLEYWQFYLDLRFSRFCELVLCLFPVEAH